MELERWKKATASNANGGCVEINGERTKIRDSKNPNGPRIVVGEAAVAAFLAMAKKMKKIDN